MKHTLFYGTVLLALSSCTVYNRSVFVQIDDRHTTRTENIKNNTQQWVPARPASSPTQANTTQSPLGGEKIKPKVIRIGCKPFELPALLPLKKLTGQMIDEMKPRSASELNNILLDNIQDNKRIDDLNRIRIKEAHDKHLLSCRN